MTRALPQLSLAAGLLAALALAAPDRGAAGLIHQPRGKQCIPIHAIRTETSLDDERLVFHMDGGAAYMSHLPVPCDGLRNVNTVSDLKLHTRGIDLCVGDTAVLVDHPSVLSAVGVDGGSAAAPCKLGPFEPISEMELPENMRR